MICVERCRRTMRIALAIVVVMGGSGVLKNRAWAMDAPISFQARGAVGDERIGGLSAVTSDLRYVLIEVKCGRRLALGRRWQSCTAQVASEDEVELLKDVERVFLQFENNLPTRGGRDRNIYIRNGQIFFFGQNIYRSAWDIHNIGSFVGENKNGELDLLRGGVVEWKDVAMIYKPHHVLWFEAKNGEMLQIYASLIEDTVELEVNCSKDPDSEWQECIGGVGFPEGPEAVYSLMVAHRSPKEGGVKLRYGSLLFFGVNVWWDARPLLPTGYESQDEGSIWKLRSGDISDAVAVMDIYLSEWDLDTYQRPHTTSPTSESVSEQTLNGSNEDSDVELNRIDTPADGENPSEDEDEECCFTMEGFHHHASCKKECRQSECSIAWRSWPTMDECCAPGNAFESGCDPEHGECYVVKNYQGRTCWRDDTKCHQGHGVWPSLEECCESAFDGGCAMENGKPPPKCWYTKYWPLKTCVEMSGEFCITARGWETQESCCAEGFESGCDSVPPVPCYRPSYVYNTMKCILDDNATVCSRGWGVYGAKEDCCKEHRIKDCS